MPTKNIFGAVALGLLSLGASAADYSIDVQNLTRGSYFTPLLVAAHPDSAQLFEAGQPADSALQVMAEGGDISQLEGAVQAAGGITVANPAGGLLAPGMTTTASFSNTDNMASSQLSIVGMILPSNDGFVGLGNLTLPTEAGTYVYELNAYDAGTEGNDEIRGSGAAGMPGMPVPPPLDPLMGTNGTGINAAAEGFVHIHRGVLGDLDATGGTSDIDASQSRWLNPVARITVTVN
ncbi:spondin domain-containing protein [Simiduia sp. 21SJ11W-1]|uniref:spondin domain-containing protein n=1 Tax=Simiduia sp. 21SJ11W-1 TaxID=2909669 RepID=UPI00209F8A60|nr:spondin domain-containing protein [Simiduia sp. 21SJ11W-1]UTA46909.1 spondin domain-containing protein [Simiduia sp. 21SJ11W-1]